MRELGETDNNSLFRFIHLTIKEENVRAKK